MHKFSPTPELSALPHLSLLIRVDASASIGVGHAMRCFAVIQQAISMQISVCLAYKTLPNYLKVKFVEAGVQLHHLKSLENEFAEMKTFVNANKVNLCLLDGYHFNEAYRQEFSTQLNILGVKFAMFDDLNNSGSLYCDLVINAMPAAEQLVYEQTTENAKLLLGLDYSVLREEYIQYRKSQKSHSYITREKLIVNFGGSDIGNLTLPAINYLAKFPDVFNAFDIQIIIGGACKNTEHIYEQCRQYGFECIIQANNMAELLFHAKMAIVAPGSIVYELAYCHVPSVFFTIAENQQLSAKAHENIGWSAAFNGLDDDSFEQGMAYCLMLWKSHMKRAHMSRLTREIVDDLGTKRIIDECERLIRQLPSG